MNIAPTNRRPSVLRARLPLGAALLAAAVLLTPAVGLATSFEGYGETGWDYDNKRDCCDDAVYFAQDHAIAYCEESGGQARVRSGSARGSCDWDARGASYDRVYRCTARTRVDCR